MPTASEGWTPPTGRCPHDQQSTTQGDRACAHPKMCVLPRSHSALLLLGNAAIGHGWKTSITKEIEPKAMELGKVRLTTWDSFSGSPRRVPHATGPAGVVVTSLQIHMEIPALTESILRTQQSPWISYQQRNSHASSSGCLMML